MTENIQVRHATVFDDATRHTARVYAEALLDAAEKRQQTQEVLQQLEETIEDVLDRDSAFALYLASAVVGRDKKHDVLRRAFEGKVNELVYHFLLVLNDHDRLGILHEVAITLREMYDRRAGRMRVGVQAATPLADDQQERLRQELRDKFGREPILSLSVDADLLGGLVVRVDDWVYDGSVRARLQRIQNQLIERSNYVSSH